MTSYLYILFKNKYDDLITFIEYVHPFCKYGTAYNNPEIELHLYGRQSRGPF